MRSDQIRSDQIQPARVKGEGCMARARVRVVGGAYDGEVARMRVAMEEAMAADLLEVGSSELRGEVNRVVARLR
jgi:hypothetical protein